jgi:hypothetical protein
LEALHGLEITGGGIFTFYMPEIVACYDEEDIPYLNRLCNEPLCPFAYITRVILLVSQSGRVVILHHEWTNFRLYNNLKDGLEAVFFPSDEPKFMWLMDEDKPVNFRKN